MQRVVNLAVHFDVHFAVHFAALMPPDWLPYNLVVSLVSSNIVHWQTLWHSAVWQQSEQHMALLYQVVLLKIYAIPRQLLSYIALCVCNEQKICRHQWISWFYVNMAMSILQYG